MALLRPSELARVWELHPKTVYLWIREGRLPAIKTPGAQYRVRTDDARAYCEKNGLPMPKGVASPAGTVAIIGKAGPAQRALAKACKARGTAVEIWPSALEGLLAVAGEEPDLVAIDARAAGDVKLADALRALRKNPKTAKIPVVVYDAAGKSAPLVKLGASTVVPKGDAEEAARVVVEALEAISSAGTRRGRG
jgi:excisionase family DNA binding protein